MTFVSFKSKRQSPYHDLQGPAWLSPSSSVASSPSAHRPSLLASWLLLQQGCSCLEVFGPTVPSLCNAPIPDIHLVLFLTSFLKVIGTTFFKKFKANTPHSPDFNSPHSPDFLYQSYYLLRFIFSLPPIYFILYLFIYLAVPGLSCGMWDLVPSSSLTRGPLHWKHGILATGPPGKFHPRPPSPPYPLEFKFLEGREFSLFYTLLGSSGWNTTSLNMLSVSECIDWMRCWRKGRCPSSRFGDLR